ncbi:hypothetical protein BDV26DRAFT_29207 [Aspergillus bertholletiae]|uniref:Uncharacterized protein n=1 Tax=Aspergillus bertholletiae TaxID=1226010 RepID=A0A5N7BKE5_9EURO|nr:hypothetical protein BDV26DRAFT_29207 [Aspergillus bertholletiae]
MRGANLPHRRKGGHDLPFQLCWTTTTCLIEQNVIFGKRGRLKPEPGLFRDCRRPVYFFFFPFRSVLICLVCSRNLITCGEYFILLCTATTYVCNALPRTLAVSNRVPWHCRYI